MTSRPVTPTPRGVDFVRPRQGRVICFGFRFRRFHLRLFTVSRFAGRGIIPHPPAWSLARLPVEDTGTPGGLSPC